MMNWSPATLTSQALFNHTYFWSSLPAHHWFLAFGSALLHSLCSGRVRLYIEMDSSDDVAALGWQSWHPSSCEADSLEPALGLQLMAGNVPHLVGGECSRLEAPCWSSVLAWLPCSMDRAPGTCPTWPSFPVWYLFSCSLTSKVVISVTSTARNFLRHWETASAVSAGTDWLLI